MTISYLLFVDMIVWQRSEVLFLKWYSTLPQIAFYTLAFAISSKLTEVSSTFSITLLPYYSASYGCNGLKDIGLVYAKAVKYLQIVMVFPCLLTAAICAPLVELLYGKSYQPVVLPLQLLLISLAITSIGVVGAPLLLGTEKQSFMAKYGTCVAVLNLSLDFALIPKHGAIGATVANCAAQIVGVLGAALYVVRYSKASFPWRSTATVYLSTLLALVPVGYCFYKLHLGFVVQSASVIVSALFYLGLLVWSGEIGKADFGALREAVWAKVIAPNLVESSNVV